MKTKKDYKHAQIIVKGIIDNWDPYALLAGGAPNDEFDEEINQIVRHLPQIKTANDAIQAISSVMSTNFDAENFTPEKCTEVGEKLYRRCKEEGIII